MEVRGTGSYKTAQEQLVQSITGANMERICPSIHQGYGDGNEK